MLWFVFRHIGGQDHKTIIYLSSSLKTASHFWLLQNIIRIAAYLLTVHKQVISAGMLKTNKNKNTKYKYEIDLSDEVDFRFIGKDGYCTNFTYKNMF